MDDEHESIKPEIKVWEDEPTSRQERQFDFGYKISDLSDLDSQIWDDPNFKEQLSRYLERQNWGDVFNKIQGGDKVIFFSSPAIEMLKIKYLNDVIFGPQVTDDIIAKKRMLLSFEFKQLAQDLNIDDPNSLVLLQDFKQDVFRLPVGIDIEPQKLNEICERVNVDMVKYITEKIEMMKNQSGLTPEQRNFADNLSLGKGYRLTYGTTTVESQSGQTISIKDKSLALQRTYAISTIARAGVEGGGYGKEYSTEDISQELDRIKQLKKELKDKTITDVEDTKYKIFSDDGLLNRDLLRLIRKEKFKCPANQRNLFDEIKKYVKSINLVDLLKPFIYDELNGGNLEEKIDKNNKLANKLKSGEILENNDKKDIVLRAQSDSKDRNYTSADVFHAQAASQLDTSYIAIDVLDVGLDQIRECEELIDSLVNISNPEEKIKAFEEAALKAGDKTTKYLREIRKEIANTINKYFTSGGEPILALVGGDELTLALENRPNDKDHERKINELQFKIKKRLQKIFKDGAEIRMVRTAMARSNKFMSDDENPGSDALVKAHRDALKRTEQGTAIAKDIEELERKLKNEKYKAKILVEASETVKNLIEAILKPDFDFIVKERQDKIGDFDIINNEGKSIHYIFTLGQFLEKQLHQVF